VGCAGGAVSQGVEEQMDNSKAALQRAGSAASDHMWHGPSLSLGSRCAPTHQQNRGDTLIFVLLLSLGLWAIIWAGVLLFGAYV
jgi:hypothetical protein